MTTKPTETATPDNEPWLRKVLDDAVKRETDAEDMNKLRANNTELRMKLDKLALELIPTTVDDVEREEWRQERDQLRTENAELKRQVDNCSTHMEVHCCRTHREVHMDVLHLCQERATLKAQLAEVGKDKERLAWFVKWIWETRWVSDESLYQSIVGKAAEVRSGNYENLDECIATESAITATKEGQ